MMKKTTKKDNSSKLSNYTAMAGAVLATGAVNAQFTYVDVNPDVLVNTVNSPYGFDFNNDANADLEFSVTQASGAGTTYYPGFGTFTFTYAGNSVDVQAGVGAAVAGMVTGSSSTFAPAVMIDGSAINAGAMFGSGGNMAVNGIVTVPAAGSMTFPIAQGPFLGASDVFMGAKFTAGPNTHYGWVRLTVEGDASAVTIKDYAYNTVPDEVINAGQVANLQNVAIDNKVTIKTTLNEAFINVTPDLIGGSIAMIDMTGREVSSVVISDINTTVSFEGLETGIYNVSAQFEAGAVNKKVYVK